MPRRLINDPSHEASSATAALAYLHGYIASQIDYFAKSIDISSTELAHGLGALLLGEAGGPILGPGNRMSDLLKNPAPRNLPAREVEMVSRPHIETARSVRPQLGDGRGVGGVRKGAGRPLGRKNKKKVPPPPQRKNWFSDKSTAERQAIIRKRVEATAATKKRKEAALAAKKAPKAPAEVVVDEATAAERRNAGIFDENTNLTAENDSSAA
jgi:hypothetical protein